LPIAVPRYAGNFVKTAYEILSQEDLSMIFGSKVTHHRPVSISLEHEHGKLMIPFSEGRTLEDALQGPYYQRILEIAKYANQGTIYNCNSGLNKGSPSLFQKVNEQTKKIILSQNCRYRKFVCTDSFKKGTEKDYYTKVISDADVVSYNELEIAAIYKAITENPPINLVHAAREIASENQLVVIHTKEGAICYAPNKAEDFEYYLRIAVNAASLRCMDGEHHTEKEIIEFMDSNGFKQNTSGFLERFNYYPNMLPADFVGVETPLFPSDMELNNTGAGATVGAIFVGYLNGNLT